MDSSLLLPSVLIPIKTKEPFSYVASVITRMDQECAIHRAEDERDHALIEAKKYRDIAENLKKEKREIEEIYTNRVEVVRDFWRSKIIEGDSRGGKMVRDFSTQK